MTIWIAAVLIVAAVALFVAAPLTDGLFGSTRLSINRELEQLKHEQGLAVQGLRELEFDRQMGKLDDDDYHRLRKGLEARALRAMSALTEQRGAPPATVAAASSEGLRAGATEFCPHCGARTGGGACNSGVDSSHSRSMPPAVVNSVWSPVMASWIKRS